jgi:DNA-binding transcriptional LysR family regulator
MSLDVPDPRLLRAFIAVAEELHFGRAARRLHLSQPPLSMQIRRLEELVGARLFDRDRRHVALTDAGAVLLGRVRVVLGDLERACRDARRVAAGELGSLAIGYTPTATYEILPRLVTLHRRRRPDTRLELFELRSGDQPAALAAGRIEVGLACGPLGASPLVERVLVEERFVVAVARAHPLARRSQLRLTDLEGEPWVLVRRDVEPAWADGCAQALARAGLTIDIAQETDTKMALLGLVAANVGLSLVSASMRRVRRDGVVFRELADLRLRLPLVALAARAPSPRAAAFVEMAVSVGSPR